MKHFWILALAVGCGQPALTGDLPATQMEGVPDNATWNQHIAPLLADRCAACHHEGGIGPFGVEDYESVVPWGPAIAESVMSGRMPPFYATDSETCNVPLEFADNVRLNPVERATVQQWVNIGMPEGDPDSAVEVAVRTPPRLDPDTIVQIPQPFSVDGTQDIYQCFRIPLENKDDIWIDGVEILPDNDLIVHHVLVWHDPEDQAAELAGPDGSYPCSGLPGVFPFELIAAWTPGGSPMMAPGDSGTLVHPGASLVVNVHYHPTGTTTEVDQTELALTWKTEQPANHITWYLVDIPFGARATSQLFQIPANEEAHQETLELDVPEQIPFDIDVFAITPHMHYLGTDMQVELISPNDPDMCLINAQDYRFDFQTSYVYDPSTGDLPRVRPGDTIRVTCTYNNSRSNPFLALQLEAAGAGESPIDVNWGEETGDEMCMAMMGLIIPPVDWLWLAESFL